MNRTRLLLFVVLGIGLLAQQPPPPPPKQAVKPSVRRTRMGWQVQIEKLRRWVDPGLGGPPGAMRVRILISPIGTVESVEMISGDAKLAEAVVAALRQWEFYETCTGVECLGVETIADLPFPNRLPCGRRL